jgi:adenine phosphoribosyltransferase
MNNQNSLILNHGDLLTDVICKDKLQKTVESLNFVMDYPVEGIEYIDITPLLANTTLMKDNIEAIKSLLSMNEWDHVDAIVGIESRGFIFSSILSYVLKKPLVIVRKVGKLPPPTSQIKYDLEYGSDTLEVSSVLPEDIENVVIIDDILATGGTINATEKLLNSIKINVVTSLSLINLSQLNKLSNHRSVYNYE